MRGSKAQGGVMARVWVREKRQEGEPSHIVHHFVVLWARDAEVGRNSIFFSSQIHRFTLTKLTGNRSVLVGVNYIIIDS